MISDGNTFCAGNTTETGTGFGFGKDLEIWKKMCPGAVCASKLSLPLDSSLVIPHFVPKL